VPGAPHPEKNLPVVGELQGILRHRGAQDIADEMLEAGAVARGHSDVGVQVEAPDVSLTLAAERDERLA
jgi:hypothetical protein